MESFRHHQRSPNSDRFLGLFSPPPADDSNDAADGEVELHEAEVLWTSTGDSPDTGIRPPSAARGPFLSPSGRAALRRPLDRGFGILAALPEEGDPASASASASSLLQRKPSISSASSSASNSPSSSFSSSTITAARMIPSIPKPKPEYSLSMPAGRMHQAQSLPVTVPVAPRRARRFEVEAADGADDGDGQEMMPPHEIVARTYGSGSPMTTFSVLEGQGRTLKGRDLRRVRDAVFRQTGFQD